MKSLTLVKRSGWIVSLLLMAACGQSAPDGPAPASAGTVNAAARLVALSGAEDTTPEDWFALATTARESADYATAAEALNMAASELPATRVSLERARLAVAQGQNAEALAALQALYDAGFNGVPLIRDDPVLASLGGDAGFASLIDAMTRRAFPCEHDPRFAEFDFWLGSWEVRSASGQLAGRNRIERAERGCMLTEHWTNTAGGTGMSINYVDKSTDEWVQIWNSQDGAQIHVRGGLTDEGMALSGTIHDIASSTTAPFRGLWTPLDDGRVRQYFEQADDQGNWVPWFEGFYSRQATTGRNEESR